MRITRRTMLSGTAACAIGFWSSRSLGQPSFPTRPVEIVVGFSPGSQTDITARIVASRLQSVLGQNVVVQNRVGAGSEIAARFVSRAEPDGHTLFLGSIGNITNFAANPSAAFDITKELAPVGLINAVDIVLVTDPALPVSSLQELIALAKERPDELTYASPGTSSAPHLIAELFSQRAGIMLVHVPYSGSAQAATELVAGRISLMFSAAPAVVPFIAANRLKAVAAATQERIAALPDVPTMAEQGMSDVNTSLWNGLMVPLGTPAPAIDILDKALVKALEADEVTSQLRQQGMRRLAGGPGEFRELMADELARWDQVVSAAGLKDNAAAR